MQRRSAAPAGEGVEQRDGHGPVLAESGKDHAPDATGLQQSVEQPLGP